MKKVILTAFLLMGTVGIQAQEWSNDLDQALAEAARENKKILLFFSVPEACDSCLDLESNVFNSEEFKVFARDYILVRPEFRDNAAHPVSAERKARNLLIVEKYNKDGFFPLVVMLDKNSKVIRKIGTYNNETPQKYIRLLQSL